MPPKIKNQEEGETEKKGKNLECEATAAAAAVEDEDEKKKKEEEEEEEEEGLQSNAPEKTDKQARILFHPLHPPRSGEKRGKSEPKKRPPFCVMPTISNIYLHKNHEERGGQMSKKHRGEDERKTRRRKREGKRRRGRRNYYLPQTNTCTRSLKSNNSKRGEKSIFLLLPW